MNTSLLAIDGLSKSFGGTHALQDVCFEIGRGEVHALLGENGAGKSTLVKSLSGIVVPDFGTITISGHRLHVGDPVASRKAGISTAFQELSLLPNLSVAENLLLGERDCPRSLWLRRSRLLDEASRRLEEVGLADVDPTATVGTLALATRQKLEIGRAILRRPALLILDEPTATLPDADWVFEHVRQHAALGNSVLYITHKLSEIRAVCGRGTVLRNGRIVGTFDPLTATESELITAMLGRSIEVAFPARPAADAARAVALDVRAISVGGVVKEIDLHVGRGEIVGVAALEGQGQRELFYSLAGLHRPSAGQMTIDGKAFTPRSTRGAMSSKGGTVLVPEERKTEGLFLDLPSTPNVSVPVLTSVSTLGWLNRRREQNCADKATARVGFAHQPHRSVGDLSGGNQQKLVLARALLSGANHLLLFDPTRGVDAGTKLELYRLIRELADAGHSILLYSTEIPELTGLCDRIYALYGGRVVKQFDHADASDADLLKAVVQHDV